MVVDRRGCNSLSHARPRPTLLCFTHPIVPSNSTYLGYLGDGRRPATDTLCPRRTDAGSSPSPAAHRGPGLCSPMSSSSLDGTMEVKCYVCCCYPYPLCFIQNLPASFRSHGGKLLGAHTCFNSLHRREFSGASYIHRSTPNTRYILLHCLLFDLYSTTSHLSHLEFPAFLHYFRPTLTSPQYTVVKHKQNNTSNLLLFRSLPHLVLCVLHTDFQVEPISHH
ncbi:hypothetical protein LZ31DRAFT_98250 [Colletotrichum somersetense]|nr:hypothetical protein LZ31DRAFT_98250 [Colletotrichum somersetense]